MKPYDGDKDEYIKDKEEDKDYWFLLPIFVVLIILIIILKPCLE